MSLLLRSAILGPFLNTLTTADKCPGHDREIFPGPIQKALSKKLKFLSQFFIAFVKFP